MILKIITIGKSIFTYIGIAFSVLLFGYVAGKKSQQQKDDEEALKNLKENIQLEKKLNSTPIADKRNWLRKYNNRK